MTDQTTDTTAFQLEPMSFIEVTYKNMGVRLPSGVEMTQRELHPIKVHPNLDEAHKNWGPIVYCTAYSKLESILCR